jgi:hypothetical protein
VKSFSKGKDLGLLVSGNKKVLVDRIRTGIDGYYHGDPAAAAAARGVDSFY